ncbi:MULTISPECIES: MBL fold metallo-hydrolase [unclassified Nocardioides]|uniref:MBL fold metallo-hydrolase n=1 Tax=unclassified Nocardioides TaxID=2615069 RepID=UPI001151D56B|nr:MULTISPECIES: MBL fold metallo-hydrolase [unclassified Nocardioides]TQK73206.1 glyoxylase-like metal-dependent hydrolase (beta-lactamase superfamily II) [Nocardioides sp. SLBN-35]WGY02557.1 MBL fold metallo-hydrolase [Nocardioides sp. QY071]
MSTGGVATGHAISPDSGRHWADEGAWEVAEGVHRIPLPLPMDALKAINVYVVQGDDGLTLIDGGWSIPVARELLDTSLRSIGSGFGDIKRFLVTHVHRDHFTLATVLGHEYGADVALGREEQPALELLHRASREGLDESPFLAVLRTAGAEEIAELWAAGPRDLPQAVDWAFPSTWLEGDQAVDIGRRRLDAVHTPGHTPGHYVFADQAEGVLFSGDHVLPTITPSIGFTVPPADQPLGQFMASLARVRELPDLRILPAHGPVAPSSYQRVDELLAHHEDRLSLCLDSLRARGAATSLVVAKDLGWTRHERAFGELDVFSQGMAAMETKAHLDLLVARGQATAVDLPDGVVYTAS